VERLSKEVGPSALAEITSKEGKLVRKQAALDDRRRQQLAAREAQRRRRQLKEEETLRAKIERESELRAQLVADGEKRRRAIEAEREERRRVEAGEHIIDWSNRGIALLPKELFLGAHNQERLGDVLTLDLSNNDLRLIPAFGALYWFNSLRKLDVSDNMLRELPGEINALTELVLMNAARNQMTSIPKEIGSLHELKALDLSHNLLSDLPLELSGLTTLTYLNLSSNKLLKLPRTMGQLSALRRLDVSSNALGTELGEALSSTLGDMEELEVLDLSWNAIAELPYSFGERQSKLHTLTLSNNKLTHLPDAIDGMVALESLVVARNGLLLLPEQMERLTALTRLVLCVIICLRSLFVFSFSVLCSPFVRTLCCISFPRSRPHNELPALPRCFGGLVNCTEMDLSHNRVAILDADAMSRLTSLVSLNLRSNQLEHLPKTIGALCVLETLELGFNVLHGQLATSIGTLTKLNALGIDNNRLEALPANIGFLKLLDELDASHNNLSYLPESIAQLNIRRLQLSNNRIRELPFALGELPNLEEFDIRCVCVRSLSFLPFSSLLPHAGAHTRYRSLSHTHAQMRTHARARALSPP
jgi:Leucine-rich repeat (LRR) protein